MINKPMDWDTTKAAAERITLPADAYICRIKQAAVRTFDKRDGSGKYSRLDVAFDIADGEYADFYEADFDAQPDDGKRKWKGVLRVSLPDESNPKAKWTVALFKAFTEAVEKSNLGYKWNFDEATLKGKTVGILFRNEQWVWQGKSGWKAQPFRALSVADVNDKKFTLPKEKANPDADKTIDIEPDASAADVKSSLTGDDFKVIDDTTEDLPF